MRLRLRLRGVLLVLALLLAATAVVPVLLLGDADDGAAARVAPAPPFNSSRVKAVSWQPRIFVYRGFLSDAECDHLVELGKKKVQRSMVADNDSGKSVMSEVRTSSGTFLDKRQVNPTLPHPPAACHCRATSDCCEHWNALFHGASSLIPTASDVSGLPTAAPRALQGQCCYPPAALL